MVADMVRIGNIERLGTPFAGFLADSGPNLALD